MNNFLAHTDEIRQEMLAEIGLSSSNELFDHIDAGARLRESLDIPDGISELEMQKKIKRLALRNKSVSEKTSFLGGGTYNRFIPACIANIVQRSEFITAYTPYQPEVSQGTLQVMYEYQTMICNLTGMDVANASVYDAATACAEALLMAVRIKRKNAVLVPSTLNPEYAKVIETYCTGADIEIDYLPQKNGQVDIERLKELQDQDYACVLIQNPNYFGCIEMVQEIADVAQSLNALFITCVDPTSLAIMEAPGNYGADIAVGDIQPLGIPMSFGGPHCGFIACKTKYMRQLPGRIAGMTVDEDGKRAFTLTLQAREQHIRRSKATSNICSNQALMALQSTVYLTVLGIKGLKDVASISAQRAHFLAEKINEIEGFSVLYDEFLYEFIIKVDPKVDAQYLLDELESKNIFGGIRLEKDFEQYKNCVLTTVTEMNSVDDIYFFVNALKEISQRLELQNPVQEAL